MKRATALALALLIMALACMARAEAAIMNKAQLNQAGMKVGVNTGSASSLIAQKEFPNAEIVYYEDSATAYEAVAQGKADAYVFDRVQLWQAILNGRKGVHLLDESLDETIKVAVGISPKSPIPDLEGKLDGFLAELRQDGTLEDMYHRWAELGNTTMPDIRLPAEPKYHLRVATAGIVPPFSYYVGANLHGYDIEMARRFAAWLGADLEFKVYDFGAIIPAAVSGDVDCIMSNLNVTEERREAIPFSDIIYENSVGIMVRGDVQQARGGEEAPATTIDWLNGKTIGTPTGGFFDQLIKGRLPDASFSYFTNFSDIVAALRGGKISAFCCDEPVLMQIMGQNSDIAKAPEDLNTFDIAFIFNKDEAGKALCGQMSEFIRGLRDSGELTQLQDKWFAGDMEKAELRNPDDLSGGNGTLRLAVDALNPPFVFMRGQDYAGFEVELALRFCERYGYGLTITNMDFDAVLPSVEANKADFGAASITVTEERTQSIAFSEPHYTGHTVLGILKDGAPSDQAATTAAGSTAQGAPSFWEGIANSFTKTFLRENRWQLFVKGVINTLVITLATIFFGTALGFLVFMLCRNGNPVANQVTRFCLWLVQGMPMVVLLMILYYIIFGSVAINGIVVAVIGFTFTFGASVFGLLRMGVGAVEAGQYEAAYALGYSNRRTFFRIILPQALPHVLPAYRGEIVGLIKATAVVGYIAVQDLTKMGDIVRSRTYEAFFPLIAVTIIYFLLEGLIGFFVSRVSLNFNPKRRKPGQILRGVKTDDPD